MAVPFPRGTFKVDPGPGEHGVSVLFKPTQSTIVFSITSPGALATEYQVYHVNTGGFRRFSETEVVEAARELALHFVERAGPREIEDCASSGADRLRRDFVSRAHVPEAQMPTTKQQRRRALELLEASIDGCTEAIMLAYGFKTELLIELINAGFATTSIERMVAGGRRIEVTRMRITAAGRRALAKLRWP